MTISNWLRALAHGRTQRTRRSGRRPAFCRILLERLEDRLAPAIVPVTANNLNDWQITASDGNVAAPAPSALFEFGPATPPLAFGSLELRISGAGSDAAQARNTAFSGTFLNALSALGYSSFVEQNNGGLSSTLGNGGQAPYIILNVDNNNDGVSDDLLFFEPVYQDATFFPSNPQGPLALNTWQSWDALAGGWYSINGAGGSGPGTNVKPLSTFFDPDGDANQARIVNTGTGLGGLRLVTGFGGPADWGNFIGNIDNVRVAAGTVDNTYDFEPASIVYVDDNFANPTPGEDPDGAGPAQNFGQDSFATIQEGVDAVVPGGTVIVMPGTYVESVAVNKSLTLDGSTSLATDVVIDPVAGNGIDVTAGNVTIRDLRVTGAANGIDANAVADLTLNNVQSDTNTNGVSLTSVTGTTSLTLVVATGNSVSGLVVNGAETLNLSDLTITGNTSGGQISSVTNLNFTGTTGAVADAITASGVSLQHTRDPLGANVVNQALALSSVANLSLAGDGGDDTFDITPAVATTINVDGDLPTPPASPGDSLTVNTAGTTNPVLAFTSTASGFTGSYTFADRQPVNFQEIETLANTVDLRVIKDDAPDPVIAGTNVSYTIVVSNPGTLGVNGATVTDVFPAVLTNVTFTSVAAGGATGNTAAGTGNINDTVSLPAGSSITYTVTGTVPPSATGSLSNTATVTPPAGITDSAPGDNSDTETTTINAVADLAVAKTDSPDPVKVAGNITYTITLTNNGSSDALGVTLSDVVPANTTFVSFTAPAGFTPTTPPPGGTGTVTATTPTFVAGAVATFTLVVRVDAQAPPNPPIVNTVTVTSATPDNVPANNSATATTQIAHVPYIAVGAATGFRPRVAVISPSGAKLAAFLAFNPNFTGGVRVAVGDVNGDGVSDIIVAQGPGGGFVKIVDGTKLAGLAPNSMVPNTALLGAFFSYQRGFKGGVFVAAGDVNGDGRDDIVTGQGGGANERVKVIDAARLHLVNPDGRISFAALHGHFLPYQPNFRGGVAVAAGDVNGDDKADVLTGPAGGTRPVKVVNGTLLNLTQPDGRISNAALLAAFFAYEPSFTGGVSLAADFVNGDNRADIVTAPAFGMESRVNVIDATRLNQVGGNGQILPSAFLASQVVFEEDFRGGAQVGAMDLDNDGLAEILAGFGPTRRRVLGLDMLQNTTQLIVDVNFGAQSLGGNS